MIIIIYQLTYFFLFVTHSKIQLGDGSAFDVPGPKGSDAIESLFEDFFKSQGAKFSPTEFDGRSDYGPFIDVGIPSGG